VFYTLFLYFIQATICKI